MVHPRAEAFRQKNQGRTSHSPGRRRLAHYLKPLQLTVSTDGLTNGVLETLVLGNPHGSMEKVADS